MPNHQSNQDRAIDEILSEFSVKWIASLSYDDQTMGLTAANEAKQQLKQLLARAEEKGKRSEEHYWIDWYASGQNSTHGGEEPHEKMRYRRLKETHQNRLQQLSQPTTEGTDND